MNSNIEFDSIDTELLEKVIGGKNNWQANVSGILAAGAAGAAGAAIGAPVCGLACGYIGAKTAITLWAGVTGATGGFK
ncbi:Blp family class II bacteriocin [Streptococcus uberis]|uniref:Blp family class II bacteriocin n=1 Tax=Streptococcus uberis TaxID=1349 RepID=UPI0006202EA7|nr:Blp family class II bacteriocin [Streptococcus uberis]KKF44599.1 bacteriocin [Streptococcus uberis Ab71]KKF50974.1 bacteriocin [Streptococcus uberis S6261]MBI0907567.1 bacteriocin BlpM [Streptococcus uberis]MCK1245556.1 Blp family class II bacteriocin [Streptococcus uberis]MEE3738983.1 Blp family class II bacteriocin [Streptococcus uberis]